jgi:hypothetical protein
MQMKKTCECGRLFRSEHSLKCVMCMIHPPKKSETKNQKAVPQKVDCLDIVRKNDSTQNKKLPFQDLADSKLNNKIKSRAKNNLDTLSSFVNPEKKRLKKEKRRLLPSDTSLPLPSLRVKTPKHELPKNKSSTGWVLCPLCGGRFSSGKILDHKVNSHNEKRFTPIQKHVHKENQWVLVVSGGLPSLGKNHK